MSREPDGQKPTEAAVGLLTDPGLPATLGERLRDALPEQLRATGGDTEAWTVDMVQVPFEAMYPDDGRLMEKARDYVRDTVWDLVVCITDQPMRDESGVEVASLHTDDRVAVVSLPALGGRRLRHRLTETVTAVVAYLKACIDGQPVTEARQRLLSRSTRLLDAHDGEPRVDVVRGGRWAVLRLLAGMIRVNQPWRLLRGLSMALAGAMTGMAFGVLYSTIWMLAVSLHPVRLVGVSVAAIAAMTVWIIVGHDLWERQRRIDGGFDPQVRLRNASTVVTVAVGAVAFFLAMVVIALAAVALVVPAPYLATTLGHPVSVYDYLVIAVMASVLGTVAGAVGSGLEDDTTVREATYGFREQERRRRVEQEAEDGTNPVRPYRRS